LIFMAMIYAVGDVSGAHLNPAVTLGFFAAKRMPFRPVPGYIVSQVLGAIAASFLLWLYFPNHPTLGATLPNISLLGAFVFEVVLTFFLMFVIIHISTGAKEKGLMAGVAVGAMIGLEAMFAGPITGASMNPARSLAPALVSGRFYGLWIYLTAPFLGVLLAVPFCRLLRASDCEAEQLVE
jgi:aquaporin Z